MLVPQRSPRYSKFFAERRGESQQLCITDTAFRVELNLHECDLSSLSILLPCGVVHVIAAKYFSKATCHYVH